MTRPRLDPQTVLEQFVDHLAPRLDPYEASVYLYLLRHGPWAGKSEVLVGLHSLGRNINRGGRQSTQHLNHLTVRKRVARLAGKGAVKVRSISARGTLLEVVLPADIPGVVPVPAPDAPPGPEDADFYKDPDKRLAILARDGHCCFYCLKKLDAATYALDHIRPRPAGGNSCRNLVAACTTCNARKSNKEAASFLRTLYREKVLHFPEFQERLHRLQLILHGELLP